MTVRGHRVVPAFVAALAVLVLLAGCSTTVSGAPAAAPSPVATTVPVTTTTTAAPTTAPTTTTTKPKPKPTTTTRHTTYAPRPTREAPPKPAEKSVTYLLTGSGTVSVRYLAGGSMHSLSHVGLPWRKTVPLSGGRYELLLTTGSDANVDAQVSVEGVVVGSGHNEGAGTGSFSGSY